MLKQEQRELALALKLQGYSYGAIAAEFGISRQRVQQIVSPPKEVRNRIVQQANGYCQKCGIWTGRSGHVHHKGSETMEDFNDIDNLQLLCPSCHRLTHVRNTAMKAPRLKEIRVSRFLTQEELAEKAGVSNITISHIETGRNTLIRTIRRLAESLGVDPADLVGPEEGDG